MQDNSSAFYKRVGALGAATALAVSGAFIAAPAVASPAAESDATSTDVLLAPTAETPASEPAVDATVTDETAEGAGTVAPGLAEALLRDLGMTVEEFEAAGELGKKAAEALPDLQATEGFVGITIEDDKIVITGSGEALAALALELDATLVAPAEVTEAPAEEASDAPSAEATEEAPAPDKITLPGNHDATVASLRADYIANVGVQGLQSIMWDGQGYVISVISVDKSANIEGSVLARGMAEVADSPADVIAEKYTNVTVAEKEPITALEDVVNGQGYASFTGEDGFACSIGFNGFNGQGDPAIISAGHCADDGAATNTALTIPSSDEAGGGTQPVVGSKLGVWGFSQFGGPGNTPVPEIDSLENVGTDIGVIDSIKSINSDIDLLPEVTKWGNPADLTADTVKITGTVDAVIGAPMCKSGRTTGWSCGEVTALGEFYVTGDSAADIRGVKGFESTLEVNAAQGDSGGSVISGENAMGLVSAGPENANYFFSTSLSDGMKSLGGYSVALFVADPAMTSHAASGTVLTDEAISGTAPAGSKVVVTRDGTATDLPVNDGTWSFTAPSTVPTGGELAFTVQAVNGYSKSAIVSYGLTVKEAPLAAPVITNPTADALVADSLGTVTGTGDAGATVSVEITTGTTEPGEAITGTAVVNANGVWELKLDAALSYGNYSVRAIQTKIGKQPSPVVNSAFRIIPSTPVITSITDGQDFTEGSNPGDISGTGIAGAEVTVTIGETVRTATVAANGSWAVSGFPVLAPGSFSVSADQTISGATSEDAYLVFSVTALQITPAGPPAPAPGNPAAPVAPAPDNNGDGLPDTGVAGLGLIAGAGALLTVGGLGALLTKRRRQLQDA